MSQTEQTISTEEKYAIPFFKKIPVSIERGEGVWVWDQEGKKYLDLTAGWGVTCIGHANTIITDALTAQSKKIIQNPDSGLTYSPVRARLMERLSSILPAGLTKMFFANSGAEANDAALKLARKASGKMNIISTHMSFHGRTISAASATGQAAHREKYNPLMPNYLFVPFNDIEAVKEIIEDNVAAMIIEPVQGEGGVNIATEEYLVCVSELCRKNNVYLIMDEVQTGFYRTGPAFASEIPGVTVDFLTMGKHIAGGFPFAGFAVTEAVAEKIEFGDHGGTYCGNPLGCAVSEAVLAYLMENNIQQHVEALGQYTLNELQKAKDRYPDRIKEVRGKGLLIVAEFTPGTDVDMIKDRALEKGLIINVKRGSNIRIFPALTITKEEVSDALGILNDVFKEVFVG